MTKRQKKVFKKLREKFTKELVLTAPDLIKKMRMEIDVSEYAIGSVLSIKCDNRQWKLVTFLSKSLNETEKL